MPHAAEWCPIPDLLATVKEEAHGSNHQIGNVSAEHIVAPFADRVRFVALSRLRHLGAVPKVGAVGAGVICLLLLVTTSLAVRRYGAELTDAARELRTLNFLLAKDTGRALQSVTLLLDAIAEQLPRVGPDLPLAPEQRERSVDVHRLLRARAAGLPQLDAITLVAADGRLLNFSRGWPVPSIRIDDRAFFKFLRDHAVDTPYLTEPVINRGSGTPTIYVAKRLNAPDGSFQGLLLGAVELSYFDRLYQSLHLGSGNLIGLWRDDGVMLASYPSQEPRLEPIAAAMPSGEPSSLGLEAIDEKI